MFKTESEAIAEPFQSYGITSQDARAALTAEAGDISNAGRRLFLLANDRTNSTRLVGGGASTGETKEHVGVEKTLIYANGDRYVGKIIEGDENKGKGRFTCESGAKKGSIYEGEFQLNKMHGHGTFTFISGSMYSGGMTDSQKNGYGIFTWANGNRYVGEHKNNKRYGIGTMTWMGTHVGQRYVGEWKNDRYDGQGTLTSAISIIHSGEWVNGEPKK